MAKLSSEKRKNSSLAKKKSFIGSAPGLYLHGDVLPNLAFKICVNVFFIERKEKKLHIFPKFFLNHFLKMKAVFNTIYCV